MATNYTNGVYDNTKTRTVNRSLSLSGSNAEVVIISTGTVTSLSGFGLLYNNTAVETYGPTTTITLDNTGLDTVITTRLSADGTEFALVDMQGMCITYTLTAGETTLFPNLTARGVARGPEGRRKRVLGF